MKKKNKIEEINIDDLPTEFGGIDLETEIYLTDEMFSDDNEYENPFEDDGAYAD